MYYHRVTDMLGKIKGVDFVQSNFPYEINGCKKHGFIAVHIEKIDRFVVFDTGEIHPKTIPIDTVNLWIEMIRQQVNGVINV